MKEILGVIADDLTGAGDTAVQFSGHGLPSLVAFGALQLPDGIRVVAAESDSRGLTPEAAARAAVAVARLLQDLGASRFYKKIDSVLRGHVVVELEAVMDQLRPPVALVAPAFPANGRITAGGYHLVRQVPVAESEAARDPVSPVLESHLPALFAASGQRKTGHLGLSTLHQGYPAVEAEITDLARAGASVIICDATTDAHLRLLAQYLFRHPEALGCGSAGLARALAGWMTSPGADTESAGTEGPAAGGADTEARAISSGAMPGPALVISGSRTQVTADQIRAFIEAGGHGVVADVSVLLDGSDEKGKVTMARQVAEVLRGGSDAVLYVPLDAPVRAGSDASARLAEALGEVGARIVAEVPSLSGVALTGGDTAKATCRKLGAGAIQLTTELYPGVPAGRLVGGIRAGLAVVTKSGGFGDEAIFVTATSFFKGK